MEVLKSGLVQFLSMELIIASKGRHLFISKDSGAKWEKWCELPVSLPDSIIGTNRWLSRLTRKEIHHLIEVNDTYFACFAFGQIYLLDRNTNTIKLIGHIQGSRPLKVCSGNGCIYYGVYADNEERNSIHLYSYCLKNRDWSIQHTFGNIRHIHGVFWDHFTSSLWVTTGDRDHESTIWQFNEMGSPIKIVTGSQQTRAVDLLFTKEFIFFATDAPNEQNYIYSIDRISGRVKKLQAVGGPVFYGRKDEDWIFFSTVVEPSEINRNDAVELWGSENLGKTWKKLIEFKKDIGHMRLFQYGQIRFPSGPGDGENLWITPYATELDHKILRIPLDKLANLN